MQQRKQRLYFALCIFILLLMLGFIALMIHFLTARSSWGKDVIIYILTVFFVFLFLISFLTFIQLFFVIKLKRYLPLPIFLVNFADKVMFALIMFFGRLLGINKEKIQKAYISAHNQITVVQKIRTEGSKLLILLPHCLQNSECPHKITIDVGNCKRCGKCDIGGFLEIAEHYGAKVKVATGGTLARKYVKEVEPMAIVAVACERDLSLGIRDLAGKIPVLGVLNSRPQGPCINTRVDLIKLEQAIQSLHKGGQ